MQAQLFDLAMTTHTHYIFLPHLLPVFASVVFVTAIVVVVAGATGGARSVMRSVIGQLVLASLSG